MKYSEQDSIFKDHRLIMDIRNFFGRSTKAEASDLPRNITSAPRKTSQGLPRSKKQRVQHNKEEEGDLPSEAVDVLDDEKESTHPPIEYDEKVAIEKGEVVEPNPEKDGKIVDRRGEAAEEGEDEEGEEGVSEYERLRLNNIKRNKGILKDLGLEDKVAAAQEKKAKKNEVNSMKKKKKPESSSSMMVEPRRSSSRMRGAAPDYTHEKIHRDGEELERLCERRSASGGGSGAAAAAAGGSGGGGLQQKDRDEVPLMFCYCCC